MKDMTTNSQRITEVWTTLFDPTEIGVEGDGWITMLGAEMGLLLETGVGVAPLDELEEDGDTRLLEVGLGPFVGDPDIGITLGA